MDLTTAEFKATYEEIKAYVKGQTGLQVSDFYVAQVKIKNKIIERVIYNVETGEMKVAQVPLKKEKMTEERLVNK